MTLAEIKTRVYFLTGSDANSYPADKFLLNLNIWNDKITGMAIRKSGTWRYDDRNQSSSILQLINLVAGQRSYTIPVEVKSIRRVEISYDGSTTKRATLLNEDEIDGKLDDDTNYTIENPRYVLKGYKIDVYPKPSANVSNALTLDVDRDAYKFTSSDLSTGTKEPGYSREFHDLLAVGVAYEWAMAKRKENAKDLFDKIRDYVIDLGLELSDRNKEEDMSMQAGLANYN